MKARGLSNRLLMGHSETPKDRGLIKRLLRVLTKRLLSFYSETVKAGVLTRRLLRLIQRL